MHDAYVEGNMDNIAETIPINISSKVNIVENIFIGVDCTPEVIEIYTALFKAYQDVFAWSYEEIPGIDSWIGENENKMYQNAKLV